MTVFFTADTHFGHDAVVRHCGRPFGSTDEMDRELVRRWNARVGRHDTVYHLGDFTLKGAEFAAEIASALAGTIHLVWGNHDRNAVRALPRWATSQYAAEIRHLGHRITLCHYAMRVWNQSGRGALMLHGHSHGGLPGSRQSLDVGVDSWGWAPVTLPEVLERIAALPEFRSGDHHDLQGADRDLE